MKVLCVGTTGADAPAEFLRLSGNRPEARFNITLGREYYVHAMALWASGLGVLVIDDTGKPNWKPLGIFEVVDPRLPANWGFAELDPTAYVRALWGYPTLVRDIGHHDQLINRSRSAFAVMKQESEGFQLDSPPAR
ncbi:hypothetical protein [Yinghuangia soli]|uniref:Uncharacterized protein n=1 Tax=Yinghuangia soli TaxID=2908204 RepID=A0AA41Q517_9ACTN|nr:hypothetical protein [Yinghuangia soli]MCF2530796.1 hypothetical protein [Yinghuangia soli]